VCAQVKPDPELPSTGEPLSEQPLGVAPHKAIIGLQQDVVKEMVNKIAWVLGSVYRQNYSNMRTPARQYAWRIVKQTIKDHGYPAKISKE